MPATGVHSVTVPGAVRAWADALRRYGTISFADALAPAIHYAQRGFPVSEKLAADIRRAAGEAGAGSGHGGRVPAVRTSSRAGLRCCASRTSPARCSCWRVTARKRCTAATSPAASTCSWLRSADSSAISDLTAHSSTWQQPIATTYAGYRVLAFPPNSQGIALLMQMNMAELLDLRCHGPQQRRVRGRTGGRHADRLRTSATGTWRTLRSPRFRSSGCSRRSGRASRRS
jgi:gamma-glutamyltranspeptidase / glutathione hydrolase